MYMLNIKIAEGTTLKGTFKSLINANRIDDKFRKQQLRFAQTLTSDFNKTTL